MVIDGNTRVYAVIGDPVSAVRSPEWFNMLFDKNGVNAVLIPLQVGRDDLAAAFAGLKTMRNLDGLVVTMPHKAPMCQLLDELGPAARTVEAVNAARREPDGRWIGDMFDGRGCVRGLRDQGHEVEGRSVFLLGTGAAGSAVAFALAEAGVRQLVIDDVDDQRRVRVAQRVREAFPGVDVQAGELGASEYDLVINATPLGMKPGDPLPFDPAGLPASTLVVDVITKPVMTPLLDQAQQSGHRIHGGNHMHAGQAIEAARFFGLNI
ncbi:MAG: shikimate dehydrogenase [Betaproteobacteria bacterium]|nr:MAG: shikimate dehydrogenase [Betaproteobacteria bacterium]